MKERERERESKRKAMKGATLVALALAAVFAVAVGEDKAYMSSSVTDGYFKRPTTGAFAKSVVVADENGELDTYVVGNVYETIEKGGESIYHKFTDYVYLYSLKTNKRAFFMSETGSVRASGLVTGVHDGKRWLYITLDASKGFDFNSTEGTITFSTDKGYYHVVAVSLDLKEIECVTVDGYKSLLPGTYNENLYVIGGDEEYIYLRDESKAPICGQNKNCFIYDIFEETPKSVTLDYYNSGSNFYPIKSDSDDKAIVIVSTDFEAYSYSPIILVFNKVNGEFSLEKTIPFGRTLATAAGEYRNNELYVFARGQSFNVSEEVKSYTSPTIIFKMTDLSEVAWANVIPFAAPSSSLSFSFELGAFDSEHLIAAFTYGSKYVDYCGSRVFLRGGGDVAVAVLDSKTGACSALDFVGDADKTFYVGSTFVDQAGKSFVVHGFSEDSGTVFLKDMEARGDVYMCNNGTELNKKCVCEDGYSGDNCEKYCNKSCGSNGECYFDGEDMKCACKNGYSGEACDKICDEPCGDHGVCYFDGDVKKCACTGNYTGEHCETFASSCEPQAECNCSDSSKQCQANAAAGLSPFFFFPF